MELNLTLLNPLDNLVIDYRNEVINDITANKQDEHYLSWFGPNWDKQNFLYVDGVTDIDDNLISLSASEITHNGLRLKVSCRMYVISKFRSTYQSINQQLIIPKYVEIANQLNIPTLWYTVHAFNKRLERYANSVVRHVSHTDNSLMPYYNQIYYDGIVDYKGVQQHSFLLDL